MNKQEIDFLLILFQPQPLTEQEMKDCEELAYVQAIEEYSTYTKLELIHLVLELYEAKAEYAQQVVDRENWISELIEGR